MKSLSSFAVVAISGADARPFLQGQLSNDVNLLSPSNALLASCNSSQGRVQCILTLIQRGDDILAVIPASSVELLIARLRKYVLRSKVVIRDIRSECYCYSAIREELLAANLVAPEGAGAVNQIGSTTVMRWWDSQAERYLVVKSPEEDSLSGDDEWLLADIRAGLPQVFLATHEAFVAQMLNLDLINGISFNKGCYTGQEIIARAHFRGAVKRRMFRLAGNVAPPVLATKIVLQTDGSPAGDVVMSAATNNGSELLAVLNISSKDAALCLEQDRAAVLTVTEYPDEPSTD